MSNTCSLLQRLGQCRVLEFPGLLESGSVIPVPEAAVGPGPQKRGEYVDISLVHRCRIHQWRKPELVHGIDVDLRCHEHWNDGGSVCDRGPVREVDTGSLSDGRVGSG